MTTPARSQDIRSTDASQDSAELTSLVLPFSQTLHIKQAPFSGYKSQLYMCKHA